MQPRTAATARLTGTYAAITEAQSVAALRPIFLQQAQQLGLEDLDAAALKDVETPQLDPTRGHLHLDHGVDDPGVDQPAQRRPRRGHRRKPKPGPRRDRTGPSAAVMSWAEPRYRWETIRGLPPTRADSTR